MRLWNCLNPKREAANRKMKNKKSRAEFYSPAFTLLDYVSVVIYNDVFSDDGKILCFAVDGADDAHDGENNRRNGTDNSGDPAYHGNDHNDSAKEGEDRENKALVDVIAKEFGIRLKKKRNDDKNKVEIAKRGKQAGS